MPQSSPSVAEIDAYAFECAGRLPFSQDQKRGVWLLTALFGTYAAIVTTMSGIGFFAEIHVNFFAATIVLATIGLTLTYFASASVRALAERLGPYGLAGFHIWRIAAALGFLYYGAQGWLPAIFVNLAGWGDMLAGVLAAIVIIVTRSVGRIASFHMIGFADFLVAVGTGIVLTQFAADAMIEVTKLPISLIPLVGVPISGATHIAAFHILWRQRQSQPKISG